MQVNLSDSEWKLMNRLWEQSPRTIMDLTASLKEDTGWSKNTVITMLARLEATGAVRHAEGGRAGRRYFPAVDREDAAAAETETLPLPGLRRQPGPDDERHGGEPPADGGGHRGAVRYFGTQREARTMAGENPVDIFRAISVTLAVLLLRRAFRDRISRRAQYVLWALVLVRLLVPVSLPGSGDFSVLSAAEPVGRTVTGRVEQREIYRVPLAPSPMGTAPQVTSPAPQTEGGGSPSGEAAPRPPAGRKPFLTRSSGSGW